MFNIGAGELIFILVVALLVLGPQRLPEFARGIGRFMREFRRQTDDVRTMVEREFYRMDQDVLEERRPPLPPPIPAGQPPLPPSPTAGLEGPPSPSGAEPPQASSPLGAEAEAAPVPVDSSSPPPAGESASAEALPVPAPPPGTVPRGPAQGG